MTVQEVLAAIVQAGGRLMPNGEKITVEASAPLPQDILALVREHKAALLAWLTQPAPAHDATATTPSTPGLCAHEERAPASPPSYPGRPMGAPFRPGQQVWLYRWDDQTPRFDTPVTIVRMRPLWFGEYDLGWCNAAGELTWHNARLAIAVETQEAAIMTRDTLDGRHDP
jgi:hypothetical protein